LSQLESLRYCEVGNYYKSPKFPIFVVGSTSHFTVLFGEAGALKESKSDILLEHCRRAFKAVEGGEENGFIASDQLGTVFKSLDLNFLDAAVKTLAASMEVSGAGIILWDDFWKATSRLMTGSSIETILQGQTEASPKSGPPALILADTSRRQISNMEDNPSMDSNYQHASLSRPAFPSIASSTSASMIESDEDMARRLEAEFNDPGRMSALTVADRSVSPMEIDGFALSDAELARRLQAEWDAEASGSAAGSVAAVTGSPMHNLSDDDNFGQPMALTSPQNHIFETASRPFGLEDSESAAKTEAMVADSGNMEFEQYGDTFSLYHYNGLRGGTLTPFRVTRLSAEEAVGASTALNRGTSHGGSGSGDLEDVVRTKWPSCMINWLGKPPPYID
jgi:hypothetical protein